MDGMNEQLVYKSEHLQNIWCRKHGHLHQSEKKKMRSVCPFLFLFTCACEEKRESGRPPVPKNISSEKVFIEKGIDCTYQARIKHQRASAATQVVDKASVEVMQVMELPLW